MSRGPKAVPLDLTEAERVELRRLLRRRGVGQALAQRIRVVLACAEPGVTNLGVAEALGVSRETVATWRRRFAERRLEGLVDAPRSGAPRSIGDEAVERLVADGRARADRIRRLGARSRDAGRRARRRPGRPSACAEPAHGAERRRRAPATVRSPRLGGADRRGAPLGGGGRGRARVRRGRRRRVARLGAAASKVRTAPCSTERAHPRARRSVLTPSFLRARVAFAAAPTRPERRAPPSGARATAQDAAAFQRG